MFLPLPLKTRLKQVITGPNADALIQNIRFDMSYVKTLVPELQTIVIDAYEFSSRWVFVAITSWATFAVRSLLPSPHLRAKANY